MLLTFLISMQASWNPWQKAFFYPIRDKGPQTHVDRKLAMLLLYARDHFVNTYRHFQICLIYTQKMHAISLLMIKTLFFQNLAVESFLSERLLYGISNGFSKTDGVYLIRILASMFVTVIFNRIVCISKNVLIPNGLLPMLVIFNLVKLPLLTIFLRRKWNKKEKLKMNQFYI